MVKKYVDMDKRKTLVQARLDLIEDNNLKKIAVKFFKQLYYLFDTIETGPRELGHIYDCVSTLETYLNDKKIDNHTDALIAENATILEQFVLQTSAPPYVKVCALVLVTHVHLDLTPIVGINLRYARKNINKCKKLMDSLDSDKKKEQCAKDIFVLQAQCDSFKVLLIKKG